MYDFPCFKQNNAPKNNCIINSWYKLLCYNYLEHQSIILRQYRIDNLFSNIKTKYGNTCYKIQSEVESMLKKASYVGIFMLIIAIAGIFTLNKRLPVGPIVLGMAAVPLSGLLIARRKLSGAVPDMLFGTIDTGLLTVPAITGGVFFGVAGAIAGGIIGDAITDGIAGFFEGGIAVWLRSRGIEAARDPVTTSLGKTSGCLLGSGLVLTLALLFGIRPSFT